MDALQMAAGFGNTQAPARDSIVSDNNSPHDYALSGDPVVQEDGNGNLVNQPQQATQPASPQQASLPENLQEMERKMVASHTRRMQEVADKARELEAARARYEQLTQQQIQQLQQPQQQSTTNSGLWDELPEVLRQNYDPSSKAIMDAIEQGISKRVAQAEQRIASVVQQETSKAHQAARTAQLGLELQGLGAEFAATKTEVPPHVVQGILSAINAQPGLSAKQALSMVAPDILEQHAMARGRQQALAELKQRSDASALQQGGGNIDMNAELPPGSDLDKYFERYARQSGDPRVMGMLQQP